MGPDQKKWSIKGVRIVATGAINGVVIVDIDTRNGGDKTFAEELSWLSADTDSSNAQRRTTSDLPVPAAGPSQLSRQRWQIAWNRHPRGWEGSAVATIARLHGAR
jgi:hypothetical protein